MKLTIFTSTLILGSLTCYAGPAPGREVARDMEGTSGSAANPKDRANLISRVANVSQPHLIPRVNNVSQPHLITRVNNVSQPHLITRVNNVSQPHLITRANLAEEGEEEEEY